jgi:hypothetical protein
MGTQLMRRVEALGMAGRLDDVGPNAHRVLLIMALNAHDTGTPDAPASTYFRGWPHLAHAALGRRTYDDAAERAVGRAIAELARVGYVKQTGRRHENRHAPAMYELTL